MRSYKPMPLYQTILWFTFFICSLVGIGVLLISPPKVAKHYDCNKIYPKFQQDIGQYMVENGFNPNSKKATALSQEVAKMIEAEPTCFPGDLQTTAIQILGH